MKNAFIIHGTGGSPEGNWFPWMKQKLEERWYRVFVPKFPTPENQCLDSWKQVFEQYTDHINAETIFVAHSLGPAFVLSVLEVIDTPISACYFAAGFLGLLRLQDFDELNTTFTTKVFDWEQIHSNCSKFYMCHGSDDPYVPIENAKLLADKLWVEIDIIQNWWHLNVESGYTEFAYLLAKLHV